MVPVRILGLRVGERGRGALELASGDGPQHVLVIEYSSGEWVTKR